MIRKHSTQLTSCLSLLPSAQYWQYKLLFSAARKTFTFSVRYKISGLYGMMLLHVDLDQLTMSKSYRCLLLCNKRIYIRQPTKATEFISILLLVTYFGFRERLSSGS